MDILFGNSGAQKKNGIEKFTESALFAIFFVLGAVVLTFPVILNYLGAGVDYAYIWAFNDLFANNYNQLNQLVFTYGPLGFLKFPLPISYNWEFGFLFLFLLRLLQAVYFLMAWKKIRGKFGIAAYLSLLVLLKITQFDLVFASIMFCTCWIAEYDKKWWTWLPAILLASVALYIKFSIGMLAFSIFGGFQLSQVFVRASAIFNALFLFFLSAFVAWITGFALTGDFAYMFTYVNNALHISSAYSAALSLHPETNKVYLVFAIAVLFVAYVIIEWKAWKPQVILPIGLGLFIVWKHSIVREEAWHMFLLVQYLMLICLFFIIRSSRNLLFFIAVSVLSMFALWRYTADLGGMRNFIIEPKANLYFYKQVELLFNKPNTVNEDGVLDGYKLPDEMTKLLGKNTVDVYPWNLLYVAANDLNLQPRPSLQSIDFNPWLDLKSAEFYSGSSAPEFILWHRNADRFGKDLGAFEGRYQLSSEPLTVDAILSAYSIEKQTAEWLLLKHDKTKQIEYESGDLIKLKLNENIAVPDFSGLLKAKVWLSLSSLGKIQSAYYKEPTFFIRYIFSDRRQIDYAILRHNAVSGLWIKPFLSSFYLPDQRMWQPDSIGFYVSVPEWADTEFTLQWQFAGLPAFVSDLQKPDSVVFYQKKYADSVVSVPSFGYADVLELPVDSLPEGKVELSVSALCRQEVKGKSRLVLSIDDASGNLLWTGSYMDGYLPIRERWGFVYLTRVIDLNAYSGAKLKIYFMNEGSIAFDIKQVDIVMRAYAEPIL